MVKQKYGPTYVKRGQIVIELKGNTMAKTLAASGGTPPGENSTTDARQRLTHRIRFVLHSALFAQAHNNQGQGLEAPWEYVCAPASSQPLAEVPWPGRELLHGFSHMPARRKGILVAWGEPPASWSKQIKVETGAPAGER
jgi:hypothetical protein